MIPNSFMFELVCW